MCKKCSLIGFTVAILILGLPSAHANEGVVRAGFNGETVHLQRLPNTTEVSAFLTKSPQQDTILYDNGTALYYEPTPNVWTAVRFTPTASFNLMAIYFAVWNPFNNAIQGCSLFVVPDNGLGLPDWPNRIWVGNVSPSLADLTWIQFDLAGPMYFSAGQDFHIVYGPAPGGSYPAEPGWWSVFDSDGTTTYRTHLSANNGQSWDTLTVADAFIRAGGWYTAHGYEYPDTCAGLDYFTGALTPDPRYDIEHLNTAFVGVVSGTNHDSFVDSLFDFTAFMDSVPPYVVVYQLAEEGMTPDSLPEYYTFLDAITDVGDSLFRLTWKLSGTEAGSDTFYTFGLVSSSGCTEFEPLMYFHVADTATIEQPIKEGLSESWIWKTKLGTKGVAWTVTISIDCNNCRIIDNPPYTDCTFSTGLFWGADCKSIESKYFKPAACCPEDKVECLKSQVKLAWASGFKSVSVSAKDLSVTVTGRLGCNGQWQKTYRVCCDKVITVKPTKKDGACSRTYETGEPVYCRGEGYSPLSVYPIYTVFNTNFADGMPIPPRVPGTAAVVFTDEEGMLLCSDLNPEDSLALLMPEYHPNFGSDDDFGYDLLVDLNGDGFWTKEEPVIDYSSEAGFSSAPILACTLRVADTRGAPGSSNNPMDIELNNSIGVGGVEFTLAFDGTLLTADSATTTSRSSHMIFSYSSGPDSIKLIMFSMTGDSILPGTGPIITVFFSVNADAVTGDSTLVHLKDAILSDPSANPISVVTEDGWFSFGGMKCDVNNDGDINVIDIVRVVNIILGKPPSPTSYELWAADCYEDGAVNVVDIVCCVNRILGSPEMTSKKGHSSVVVEIPEMAVRAEKTDVIPISVDTDIPIAGAQFNLSYDTDKLTVGKPQLTERSANMAIVSNVKANELIVLVYSETGEVIPSGSGAIVNIPFTMFEGTQGESALYFNKVVLVDPNAQPMQVEVPRISSKLSHPLPEVYTLLQSYPNPCYSETHIAYQLPKASRVILEIYNTLGQLVKTLVDENQDAGYYKVRWDGSDESGKPISSGVYFYQIQADKFTSIKKLIVLH
ncbi:MAG TPA: T9SS type A sorting domain-containing protein [bacterium (Candidatus Stahlbacteria)]|nr:T9SS type A sorting domain-containing protein [Candidatus Stahlbacteria bacterium]